MGRATSPLDAFFHPRAPLDIVRAVAALEGLSHGALVTPQVLSSQTGRPEAGGPWCEQIFGPRESGRCVCGMLGGALGRPAAYDGERCPKCGVEATSSAVRAERWAHVDMPVPMLHPTLAEVVAEIVGLGAADVLALARFRAFFDAGRVVLEDEPFAQTSAATEHAPEALLTLLRERASGAAVERLRAEGLSPESLLVRRVPVPPPGDRPPVRMPGGHDLPGEVDLRWSELVWHASRFAMLSKLGAPPPVLVGEGQQLVAAFEAVATGEPPAALRRADEEDELRVTAPSADLAGYVTAGDPTEPLGAAVLGQGEILVELRYVVVHLDERGGVLDAFPTFGARLSGVSASGRRALFRGLGGLSVRDLTAKRWLRTLPDDLPTATLAEDHEESFLVDPRRGTYKRLFEVADYPAFHAISPDGRFLWVEDKERGGGVYELERGMRVLLPRVGTRVEPPFLERDGTLEQDAAQPEPIAGAVQSALVLTAADRFRLACCCVVFDDQHPILRLAAPPPVVAFSRDGAALLVVRRDLAVLVDLDSQAVRRAYRLDGLHAALGLGGAPGLAETQRHELLARFGGAWGVARAKPSELASVAALGASRARTIASVCKEAVKRRDA